MHACSSFLRKLQLGGFGYVKDCGIQTSSAKQQALFSFYCSRSLLAATGSSPFISRRFQGCEPLWARYGILRWRPRSHRDWWTRHRHDFSASQRQPTIKTTRTMKSLRSPSASPSPPSHSLYESQLPSGPGGQWYRTPTTDHRNRRHRNLLRHQVDSTREIQRHSLWILSLFGGDRCLEEATCPR